MLHLALRQMLSKKKQTVLIFLGISFGTMIYVLIAGLQLGMRSYIIDQLLNNSSHILISGEERYVDKEAVSESLYQDSLVQWIIPPYGKRDESRLANPQGWFELLEKDLNVVAYAPRFSIQAIATKGSAHGALNLFGIDPKKHIKITQLEDYMKIGSLLNLSNASGTIVLSTEVIKKLGSRVDDTVFLSLGAGDKKPFKVVGAIKLGNQEVDETFAIAHIKDVQKLNKTPGRITDIAVSVVDIDLSQQIADIWDLYSSDQVQSWQEVNASFMQMIAIQDVSRYVITGTILLVAAFGIYNVLSIMIGQKQKEIAILRSIGYRPIKILELFFIQGIMLGSAGGIFGLLLGYISCRLTGSYDLGFEIGKSSTLIISYEPSIYITGLTASLVSASLASFFPALKASRLTPMEIIRANE
jgi:lipoprotein-releasing system permease protein